MLRFNGLGRPVHRAITDRSPQSSIVQIPTHASRRTLHLHSTVSRRSAPLLRRHKVSPSSVVQQHSSFLIGSPNRETLQRRAFGQTVQFRNELPRSDEVPEEQIELEGKQQESQDAAETPSAQPDERGIKDHPLTEEQQVAFDLVVNEGKNVFITGPAGAGKTFLLRRIIASLKEKHSENPYAVAVTADSGTAAMNFEGAPLDMFAGVCDPHGRAKLGLSKGPSSVHQFAQMINSDEEFSRRWKETQILIISGAAGIHRILFQKLNLIARHVRDDKRPFGGMQVVLSGDFHDPPVGLALTVPSQAQHAYDYQDWKKCIDHTVNLPDISRQPDAEFREMLSEVREGRLSAKTIKQFESLSRPLKPREGVIPIEIDDKATNDEQLEALPDRLHLFTSNDKFEQIGIRTRLLDSKKTSCLAERFLNLKKGAQVVLIKDAKSQPALVSGSVGRVLGFMSRNYFRKRMERVRKEWVSSGIPDEVTALDYTRHFNRRYRRMKYPVVCFRLSDGQSIVRWCGPEVWHAQIGSTVLASREQVPLLLAWKLQPSKARFLSLDFLKVDLQRCGSIGRAYEVLSRARCRDGLQVLNFRPEYVKALPKVVEYYKSLSSTPVTEEAKETEEVTGTEEPEVTKESEETEEVKETEEAKKTEELEEAEEPKEAEELKETEEPKETKEPKETEEPKP